MNMASEPMLAGFALRGRNPDVLTCIANLSNDEVFTPPELANRMLDTLAAAWASDHGGASLWANPHVRFLDPCTKSGVFLREITSRLTLGLQEHIPNLRDRVAHILQKQVFGIGITQLTAMLARRSTYCSKHANGPHSIAQFADEAGNIWFERTEHEWDRGRCIYCGASQQAFDRGEALETHAYAFIHTDDIKARMAELFGDDMQFDVIIGNPPYQLSDGGFGASALPIYNKFVEQAKMLEPRFLTMVIPSRWFGGGKGLSSFRATMLGDNRIRQLVDYENAQDVFPNVDLAGGICYFLWNRDLRGPCEVTNIAGNLEQAVATRELNEFPTFVRHSGAVPIIRKVLAHDERRMSEQVSSRKPFGLPTNARPELKGDLTLRWEKGEGPYPREKIEVGHELIDQWKVITSYVGYDHAGNPGNDGRRRVLSKIDILAPGTVCTETYLVIGSYRERRQAENLVMYMKTRFFRFLMAQFMYSHHLTKSAYGFVPIISMDDEWTDERLAQRYGLTHAELEFISSKIRPYNREEMA
ncbi:MAG: Eco57I restriction-modification methylase domain-containing protein [Ottowia sp.]|nr:Eco57I restriction-modification methylase domain-containing protein [Ottowia sp.]